MKRGEEKNKKRSKKTSEKKVARKKKRKYGGMGARAVLVEQAGLGRV